MNQQHDPARARVRVRTDADLPAAGAALVDVHATDGYPVEGVADPAGWLTSPQLIRAWVGELDGNVVGHVGISEGSPDDDAVRLWREASEGDAAPVAVLGRLFVTRDARGQALGEQLVRAATDHAEQTGRRLVLDVMTKDAAAIRLYERLGWRRLGSAEHDDGHGSLIPALCFVGPGPTEQD